MRSATAYIDLVAIRDNYRQVAKLAPNAKILAVIKADGYGHGLERMVEALPLADAYGVASVEDAQRVRQLEQQLKRRPKRLVLLSGCNDGHDLSLSEALDLTVVLHEPNQLKLIRQTQLRRPLSAWIKLDTGMHRLGFPVDSLSALRSQLAELPLRHDELVWMTHFAHADGESALTELQMQRFSDALRDCPGARSLANSAAVLRFPQSHAQWVRPGGLLYGLSTIAGQTAAEHGFRPAMRVSSRLIAIKPVAAGETVGYAESYRAERALNVGILSFGYGDGYPRHASNRGHVWLNGQLCPIVGRVSMDLMAIDISQCLNAAIGDEVVLWGCELPAEHVAAAAETISYELTCGVTRRVRFETSRRAEPELELEPEPQPGPQFELESAPKLARAALAD